MDDNLQKYFDKIVIRLDKDGIIPYLSYKDFDDLKCEEKTFINSLNYEIHYFIYHKDITQSKTIIFCPGIAPGHTAYMSEINYFCDNGFKVITLDYMGYGSSKGECLPSFLQPTRDVLNLLEYLDLKEEYELVGHSLGGYTVLNVIKELPFIKKAVIISGFINRLEEIKILGDIKSTDSIKDLDLKMGYQNNDEELKKYLTDTKQKLLFIHSKDDLTVPYYPNTKYIKDSINNPSFSFIIEDNKGHNPNYTIDSVNYLTDVFTIFGSFDSIRAKESFMKDKSAREMTCQDPLVMDKIIDFLK